jgi:glycosyltransferase involved in cell wall biosynthesis
MIRAEGEAASAGSPLCTENRPLVSVVIPVYDAEQTLDETLSSVRAQSYRHLEIIIVDDGSRDRSIEIARRHALEDARIRLIRQKNAGVAAARNRGVEASCGRYIAPVDADDIWNHEKIDKQLKLYSQVPDLGLVYTWYSVIDYDSYVVSFINSDCEGKIFDKLLFSNFVGNASSTLIRRDVLEECGLYDTSLRFMGGQSEDYALYLKIAERYSFGLIKEYLTGYRVSNSNMSSNLRGMLRARELCIAPYRVRYPMKKGSIDRGRVHLIRYLLVRAFQMRRLGDGLHLLAAAARSSPLQATQMVFALFLRLVVREMGNFTGGHQKQKQRFEIGKPR